MKNAYDIIKRPVITEQSMEAVADKNLRLFGCAGCQQN